MDGDFQQTYQAAERAYGGGDYETAHHLASGLLKQLDAEVKADDEQVRDAVLGWQAFVTLLLGHIELHGRQRPDQAAEYYQLTLDCQPQDTLADLARQGLQRSLVEPEAVQAGSLPSMLQDPFLANTPPVSTSAQSQSTAIPWLTENSLPLQTREAHTQKTAQKNHTMLENRHSTGAIKDVGEGKNVTKKEVGNTLIKAKQLALIITEKSLQKASLKVTLNISQ